ncbi:MAG TPA: isoprenylcysteine carboxylmethyltransferase family protein [Terriglobia bacterium]|nr:isoprenylcysteine carboxylmethyltransferase family protein [Terriglobia bacterium]
MKTIIQILITGFVGVAIQFALAIAGWRGWRAFFAHRPLQVLAWMSVALVVVAAFSGSSGLSTGKEEDRKNRWVLAAFFVIGFALAYFSAYTDRIGFWTLDSDTMRWTGVAVCGIGGLLRLIPVYVLGRRFSGLVAIQEDHKLETRGIYGLVRNPSYLGLLVGSLGWALAFRPGVGVILTAALLVPLVARIRAEERLLREHFGSEYQVYCARTWRLLPGIY